jgi:hypothetical protein
MAFTAVIFTKFTIIQQHFMEMCDEFRQNNSRNVENAGRKSFMPLNRAGLSLRQFS